MIAQFERDGKRTYECDNGYKKGIQEENKGM